MILAVRFRGVLGRSEWRPVPKAMLLHLGRFLDFFIIIFCGHLSLHFFGSQNNYFLVKFVYICNPLQEENRPLLSSDSLGIGLGYLSPYQILWTVSFQHSCHRHGVTSSKSCREPGIKFRSSKSQASPGDPTWIKNLLFVLSMLLSLAEDGK